MNMHSNILITGGAGFIGSHLALKLVELGHTVTVLDNLSEQIHGDDAPLLAAIKDKANFIRGDVRNREDWLKALAGQHAVVHYAAETGTGQSMYQIEHYMDVNIGGTSILLDILTNEEHSIKKVVVASSRAIYGEGRYQCNEHGTVYPGERKEADMSAGDFEIKCPLCGVGAALLATDEHSKIHPSSVYGLSKQAQEEMTLMVGKAINIPAVALRYQNVYGPGQSLTNPYTGILSIFSTRIQNGNDIDVFEDGEETRDFVYISDVVDATVLALTRDEANYKSYNVGSGVATSVTEVANTLKASYRSDVAINVTGAFRLGDIRHNYADLSQIRNDLGFEPKVSFPDGIAEFAKWVDSQEVREDNYEKSIAEMKDKGLMK
jgi:dTDP-L-rhamnose 4-epimerase